MTTRSLAALLVSVLALPAAAQRVELVPLAVVPSAPGASALSAAPAASLAPALILSALAPAAPLFVSPAAPAGMAAAPASVNAAVPALAAAPIAAAAVAAAAPSSSPSIAPGKAAPAGALAPGVEGSIRFDGAQEHAARDVDAVPAPGASHPAFEVLPRPAARTPGDSERMATKTIPAWIREELPVAAAKLGRPLPSAYEADVLARSGVWVYKWHSRWTYEVPGGLPDGHFDAKFGIRVMLKMDWRKLKDPETHFRVLYAHEYTHWLQDEGLVTYRYGVEIPAVAVEQLRAMELVGWEGMKAGRIAFIAAGNLKSFADGQKWARGDMSDTTVLYYRGVLGGAAYEVGRIAGRPEAAWEFLNLVIAAKGGLSPREAFERVTGLKK